MKLRVQIFYASSNCGEVYNRSFGVAACRIFHDTKLALGTVTEVVRRCIERNVVLVFSRLR